MILITGATGHYGRLTINYLLAKGICPEGIIALARNIDKANDLKELGVNIVQGDYDDYGSLVIAFKNIEKLLFISGGDLAKRYLQHENVVSAAIEAGVKHIFYTSGARTTEDPDSYLYSFMEAHFKTEDMLRKSGLSYTFLRNGLYMDLVPAFSGDVTKSKLIYLPAGTGRVAVALRSEMAEATANVLITSGHEGKSYDLLNIEAYSYDDVAQILSEINKETIRYYSPSKQEFLNTLVEAGIVMPEEYVNILLGQANGETDMTGQDLLSLLGRKPTGLKTFLEGYYYNNSANKQT